MIIKPNEIGNDQEIEADICIVGAGIAGLTIAREFLNTKKEIIILESGGLTPGSSSDALTTGENIGFPYYNLENTRARAFGGTSHYWTVDIKKEVNGVRLRGMDAIDFEKKDWVPYSGWPISKKDLDPYYEKAHKLFKIGSYSYDLKDWIEEGELNYLDTNEGNIFSTTIFQFARQDVFFNDYYPEFEDADNIRVFLNTTVLTIETTENTKEATSLIVSKPEGETFTVKARNFILAAGGLENPRLLLLSNRYSKNGLGNSNDLVGRFFMEHPHMWGRNAVGTYYPSNPYQFNKDGLYNLHYRNGTPVLGYLALKEHVIRKNKLLNATFEIRGSSQKYPAGSAEGVLALRKFLSRIKRKRFNKQTIDHLMTFGSKANVVLYEGFRKLLNGNIEEWDKYGFDDSGININLMAEQVPNPESRVQLGNECDKFGQRKLVLDWKLSEQDLLSMRKSLEIIDNNLQKNNLGYIDIKLKTDKPQKEIKGGFHHMGTTKMHENPDMGVVDANCKLHGTHNLYIAGSSVFPTVGYANPTLTIAALAIRLADHLKKVEGSRSRKMAI